MAGTLHHGARFRFDRLSVTDAAATYRVTIELPEENRLAELVIPQDAATVAVPEFDGPVEPWMIERIRVLNLKIARTNRKNNK